ncbi:MAG: outer membrane lipoprotein-sorting protein [Acidobacteria bacterium]|nr:outer membrane lipoprotein-sorting protein [Acidobacteriota bacterium]MBI3422569.1 outer membrane lipoprotein-sorting protein [Acidobacteriota bacterium]
MLQHLTKVLLLGAVLLTACESQPKPAPTPDPIMQPAALPDVAPWLKKLATQDGVKDASAEMRMELEEANGKRAQLEFQLQRKYGADHTATFLKVSAPREDSDKALLAIEKPEAATEATSYLAGLKKLAKLGSSNTLSFHDAKVTVQELLGMELGQYSFNAGERVTEAGVDLIKVEGKAPAERNLAYPRVLVYFNAAKQQPARFEIFDERNELVKTMRVEEVKPIQGHQTLTKLAVEEHQTKRQVRLETRAIKYDQNLSDKIFTEENLKSVVTSASQQLTQ